MIRAVDLQQDPAPTIIGERVNTLGSRKVKRLVLADDLDGMLEVATSQMEEGAHALDVCVALTERTDERDTMRKLVKKLALTVEGPLVIDSTEADVLKDALEQYPGPGDRQLDQHGKRPGQDRIGDADRDGPRRGGDRADDRRRGDGQNARAQARGRHGRSTTSSPRNTVWPRRT